MGLIFLFSFPILSAWQGGGELTYIDFIVGGLMLSLIVIQTIADEQQHKYQTKKYSLIKANKVLEGNFKKGFIDTGLWKYSRHPNYTCEQLIWITFYLFSVSSTGKFINWSIIGCLLLVILFYFSAKFSEGISSKKYPNYKNYQKILQCLLVINSFDMKKNEIVEPKAKKIDKVLKMHDHERIDEFYWLNERDNPEVIDYMSLENELFEEIKSRIKEDDSSVPYFDNGYYYYTRYEKGKQYPIYCRKKDNLENAEEILIDANKMSEGHEYFRIGGIDISPDNKIMAYSVDTVSRRLYTVHFKNLETGIISSQSISNTNGGVSWANDNKTVFYNQKNVNTLRTEKVIRYVLGSDNNEEVFFESDDEFNLYSYKTKSGKYIIISSGKTISDEIRFINADRPNQEFKIFQKRIDGLEYSVDHLDDKWYIRTNINNSQNFKLMVCDENKTSSENWKDFIKHRENVLLENVEVFNEFFVVTERENGQRRFNVISKKDGKSHYIDFEEEAFSA